jgi:heme/copper-type cytochrome/quinol oxidase subunit 2
MMASFPTGWLSGTIVPAVVALALGIARRYFRPTASDKPEITESDRNEFEEISWVVYAVMLAVMVVFALTTYSGLVAANQHFANADGPAQFQLLPTKIIWMFFPDFAALCLSGKSRCSFGLSLQGERKSSDTCRGQTSVVASNRQLCCAGSLC